MRRKVIQIANSTQLISLPRKWAIQHGIKKGDELEIKEDGNKIIVELPNDNPEEQNIDLDISELDKDSLIFLVRGLFIRGYSSIRFSFKNSTTVHHRLGHQVRFLSVIHGEIARSIGYEITQERGDFVIIKKITVSSAKEFDAMLKRTFLLVIDASKDLYLGVKTRDYELVGSLEEKHNTITKFVGYTLRILYKVGYTEYENTPFLFHIISSLDMIIDILRNASRDIIENKIVATKDGIMILGDITDAIESYQDLYYKFNLKKCEQFSSARDEILLKIRKLSKSLTKEDIRILTTTEHVLEVFRDLYSSRIAMEY
ncbi:MAG: AbrB/MazE/SpoVT family DNA-binding domain-containing protein [Nanoarchaeota archaeon]|nr:AbrB/MazE/SpoVT family DNA-binding domain-containing protein [Nanoarchaeota archaeon]